MIANGWGYEWLIGLVNGAIALQHHLPSPQQR